MANVDTIVTLESGVEHPSSGQKENTTVGGDTLHSDMFLQIPFLTKDEASYTIIFVRTGNITVSSKVDYVYVWIPSYK